MSKKPAILIKQRKRVTPTTSPADDVDVIDHAVNIDKHLDTFVARLASTGAATDDFCISNDALQHQLDTFHSSDPAVVALVKRFKTQSALAATLLKEVKELREMAKRFPEALEIIRSSTYQHIKASVRGDTELVTHFNAQEGRPPPIITPPVSSKKTAAKKNPYPALFPSQLE